MWWGGDWGLRGSGHGLVAKIRVIKQWQLRLLIFLSILYTGHHVSIKPGRPLCTVKNIDGYKYAYSNLCDITLEYTFTFHPGQSWRKV